MTSFSPPSNSSPTFRSGCCRRPQCALPDFLTQAGFSGGSDLTLTLDKDRIESGDTLRGVLVGPPPSSESAVFYLIDSDGFGYRIDQFVTRTDNEAVFEIKLVETAQRKADLRGHTGDLGQ